uniref:putative pectinesterase/pectinesterase inhibitor 26 n=1 Tax=Erigeron canadensis TaxID=72917 RepID=UPI001CB8C044|nr:putative pectinesterase/pectinesterase inhibitor 26 [Erigeron canadensis]
MNKLSAVGAETETCLDEVGDRKAMSDVLLNSTLLWENALDIGANTPGIFQRPSYIPIGGRQLPGNDGRGYPRTTLSPLFKKHKTSPRNILSASISAVLKAMTDADSSFDGVVGSNDQAISDCHELVGFAVDNLHDSLNIVEKNDLPTILERKDDLMTWLSAVVSEQETCLDGFEDRPKLRKATSDVLLNSTQLASNALAIAYNTPKIFERFFIPISTSGGRRLPGNDGRGYPWWWMSKP